MSTTIACNEPRNQQVNLRGANLDTLPDEIIEMILEAGSHIRGLWNPRECLVQVALSLRLTCKSLLRNLIEWFRKQFPKCRLARIGEVHVRMTYRGLYSLWLTTTSELIAAHIKVLRIDVGHFTPEGLRGFLAHTDLVEYFSFLRQFYLKELKHEQVLGSLRDRPREISDEHFEEQYSKYWDEWLNQAWMTETGEDWWLLTEIFSRLPNLSEIYIVGWQNPFPVPWALAHYEDTFTRRSYGTKSMEKDPWIEKGGLSRVKYPKHEPMYGCVTRAAVLGNLFEALAAHPKQLTKIVMCEGSVPKPTNEEAGIWALDLPDALFTKLSASLAHLKSVHLSLSDGAHTAPSGFSEPQASKALVRFLSATPLLASFHFAAAAETLFSATFTDQILHALPHTLNAIHLHNVLLTVASTCAFLSAHRHALTSLGLTRAYLTNESWTPAFRFAALRLPHLRTVHFEQLWELHPAFADKLFFRSPFDSSQAARTQDGVFGRRFYARRDRSHDDVACWEGVRGHFDVGGEWVPVDRYDAAFVEEGAKSRWWPIARGVEEGLRVAVRDGMREAVVYGSEDVDDPLSERVVEHACLAFGKEREEFEVQPKREVKWPAWLEESWGWVGDA